MKQYQEIELDLLYLEDDDVIRTSNEEGTTQNPDELPDDEW